MVSLVLTSRSHREQRDHAGSAGDELNGGSIGFGWGPDEVSPQRAVHLELVAFRELLPMQALSAWSERLVGVALVAVGFWGLWRARSPRVRAISSSRT